MGVLLRDHALKKMTDKQRETIKKLREDIKILMGKKKYRITEKVNEVIRYVDKLRPKEEEEKKYCLEINTTYPNERSHMIFDSLEKLEKFWKNKEIFLKCILPYEVYNKEDKP